MPKFIKRRAGGNCQNCKYLSNDICTIANQKMENISDCWDTEHPFIPNKSDIHITLTNNYAVSLSDY